MENILPIHIQEVIFGSSDQKISKQVSRLEKEGKIRKIAPRLYSSNLTDPVEEIVRRNLFHILGKLYPGAVLSHRSAFEFQPTSAGHIFLTYKYTRKAFLPGITIRFIRGSGVLPGDNLFTEGLYVSQPARAFLENLEAAKGSGPTAKNLPLPEIEEKLESVIRVQGEDAINELRDKARKMESVLGMAKAYAKLNKLISSLLATTPIKNALSSPLAIARSLGYPYDAERLVLFEKLFVSLRSKEFEQRPDKNLSAKAYRNFAFFESYFSNYIEGTVFEVNEALKIIRTDKPMPSRNEDSHDVLGTYHLVSDKKEMSTRPTNAEELFRILLYRHKALMAARTEKGPGQFKDKNNRAGNTVFVDYNLVKGTLIKGFDYYQALIHPFAKAAYMMFLISEVHPFLDGNGRIARVMMNAELTAEGQSKIIIPNSFRIDYIGALKKLSNQSEPQAYIRMMERAFQFSETIYGEDMNAMRNYLEQCNAFADEPDAKLRFNAGKRDG